MSLLIKQEKRQREEEHLNVATIGHHPSFCGGAMRIRNLTLFRKVNFEQEKFRL